jgi:hypothetical protein
MEKIFKSSWENQSTHDVLLEILINSELRKRINNNALLVNYDNERQMNYIKDVIINSPKLQQKVKYKEHINFEQITEFFIKDSKDYFQWKFNNKIEDIYD